MTNYSTVQCLYFRLYYQLPVKPFSSGMQLFLLEIQTNNYFATTTSPDSMEDTKLIANMYNNYTYIAHRSCFIYSDYMCDSTHVLYNHR